MDRHTGIAELEFVAEFVLTAGPLYKVSGPAWNLGCFRVPLCFRAWHARHHAWHGPHGVWVESEYCDMCRVDRVAMCGVWGRRHPHFW